MTRDDHMERPAIAIALQVGRGVEHRVRCLWIVALALAVLTGCASLSPAQGPTASTQAPQPGTTAPQPGTQAPTAKPVDARDAARLKAVMVPLLQQMNSPIPFDQVQIGLMDDAHINAANAGGGHFYVTTGLLQKANDDQLRAVMAHETAHADLGHVVRAQRLSAGLTIGMEWLDKVIPGSSALTPIAGQLVLDSYTRKEEYEADAHGVEILQRAGYDGKTLMANTLTWLLQTEGASGGGFFSTHPATGDRVDAVRRLPDRPQGR